ncbi:MAG: tRNA (adenosine(37)-N6)-dimethylallyltransferase MiaA, partial [Dehalococcoidales bacterium]|nr:tRNA (adenosine(37)-N6)-dimethylallyltransferase MiaA [Dehalococcoidales bacterium]
EIVVADSRQLYRLLDIGTDKSNQKELSIVPHHLINIINPDEEFSLARYQVLAYQAIKEIHQRSHLPILVGGSGMYVWSVLEGWGIPRISPDIKFRRSLEEEISKEGSEKLYENLKKIDSLAAQRIDQHNIRRVIRALEVHKNTDASLTRVHNKAPFFNMFIVGLTMDRKALYHKIDLRVDDMIGQGLVIEVEKLINMGYKVNLPAMSGIGYRQIGMYLNDEMSLTAAIQKIKYETHRFVRQQYNWFKLKDKRIKWFDVETEPENEIIMFIEKFFKTNSNLQD